ncbi:hypothetical protein BRADI_5g13180v3 [Brachypodium distachyon]|uniref:KIB1-4 beta-propeller domain-containing protein n=1 Tax=Brachypodium distachyon TaxID=15368 RepID=A0A2K2CGW0_BRADI|nr:hypothetical protein BRADI_5g13180v3 [Brachypodium distachyon]
MPTRQWSIKFPNLAIASDAETLELDGLTSPLRQNPPIAMPQFRRWADLPPDLLCRIGDILDLKCYASARGACTAWRCALAPPSPSLLVVLDDNRYRPSAASLPTQRSFELKPILSGGRCVGSSNGWLALSICLYGGHNMFSLFSPISGTEILLPPLIYESRWVSKLVFAPNPAKDDFVAAAICDIDRLAYVTAGARRKVPPGSVGPDLNAPATVEPLLSESNLPFDPDNSFAPPYNTVSVFTSAKNLVFCEGNLYQIWRNASCTVTLQLPGGGHRRVSENEVLVLRYYPRRQPCWDAVTDLGGYSVFVGRNNAVSMYAEGIPGLKGNCVYWIGGSGRDQGMVFDMETGRSTPCHPVAGVVPGLPKSTICWFFLSDMVNNCNINGGRRVYQTRARVRAERAQDAEE